MPFGSVPPGGVRFGSDGRVYVLDSQAAVVYVFDETLEPIGTLGRRGEGPGEFLQPSLMAADAGRVAVYDPAQSRISVFRNGLLAWDASWNAVEDGVPERLDVVADGLLLEVESFPFTYRGARSRRAPPRLVLLRPDGTQHTVARFPSLSGSDAVGPDGRPVVFAPTLHWTRRGDGGVLVSMSHQYKVEIVDIATGSSETVVERSLGPSGAVTPEVERAVRDQTLRRFDENQARSPLSETDQTAMRESIAGMRFAERLPLTGDLVAGAGSLLFVQRGAGIADASAAPAIETVLGPPAWDVFATDGAYLGAMTFPDGFVPADGRGDLLVGVRVSELGEVAVVVHRVDR